MKIRLLMMIGLSWSAALTQAVTLNLPGTGAGLADNTPDPNYTMTTTATGGVGPSAPYAQTNVPAVWVAAPAGVNWITPNATAAAAENQANYLYSLNFTLPSNADLSTVTLAFDVAADNSLDFEVNGDPAVALAAPFNAINSFNYVATDWAFVLGTNTLNFDVFNGGPAGSNGATGLLLNNVVVTYEVVPEPGRVLLLGAGVLGLVLRRSRRG